MSLAIFKDLAEKFCSLAGLDEPNRVLNGDAVEINGITFSLMYNEKIDPEVLFIYADFGPVPAYRKVEIHEALLEANLFVYPQGFPAFGISPETKRVVFASHARLREITAEALCKVLAELSEQATDWRAHYFLTPASPSAQHAQ